MKKLIICLSAVVAVAASAFAVAPSDFSKKVPITVDAGTVGVRTATDIPVLVRISTEIAGFSYSDVADDGSNLAFGVEDGGQLIVYPHEIDTWNTAGESLVWVKVPALSSSTAFAMYYGKSGSGGSAPSSTWASYKAVWHMNEASGNAVDSTANHLDAVPSKYSSYAGDPATIMVGTDGLFGKARINAIASAQKCTYLSVPEYHMTDASRFTISGWYRMTKSGGCPRLFSSKLKYDNNFGFEVEVKKGSQTAASARGASSTSKDLTFSDLTANWHHFTFVFDGTSVLCYVDGVLNATGTIAAATETRTLSLGGNTDGSEYSFCGMYDEVRLVDLVADADRVALEYAAMGTGVLEYGAAENVDQTMPVLDSMSATVAAGGAVTITANFTENMPVADSVFAVIGGTEYVMTTSASAVPATYTTTVNSLAAGTTYDYAIKFRSTGGNTGSKDSSYPFYMGAVSAAKVCDADETTLSDGLFRLSIPSAVSSDIQFTYATSGTAVPGESYEPLSGVATIPAGSTSVDVKVTPLYSPVVASNVTVVITVEGGPVIGGSSAEVTIIEAVTDPYVRYIATTGTDESDGLTVGSPMATVTNAIASLDSVSSDHDCTIYVAAGTYSLDISPSGATEWAVVVDGRITVLGMTGDPKDVIFQRTNKATGLFRLSNANAKLKYLTLKDGKTGDNKGLTKGGGAYVQNGIVEDCIVTGSVGPTYGHSGIGIYLEAGRVSRCRITACVSSNGSQNGTGLYVGSGIAEDSLIDTCTCGDSGAVFVKDGATLLNCTVVNNTGSLWSGVRVEKATAKVVNCAIFDNTVKDNTYGGVYTSGFGGAYHNCAADVAIAGGDNCILCQPRFRDFAGKDFVPSAGSKTIDAGTTRSTYGAVSTTDLAGNPRENGTVDIGCFENTKAVAEVALEWSADSQIVPSVLSLEAASIGIVDPVYSWTIHNDDTGADVAKSGATTSVNDLTAGTYTISVSAGGCSYTSPYKYTVSTKDLYVAAGNVNAEFPYDTVAKAAANIQTALTAAGDTAVIHVQNGTYPISSQIKVDKAVRIVGESRNGVIVTNTADSTSTRVFYLNNKDAEVSTLTITGGRVRNADNGGNLYYSGNGGMVSNCLISAGRTIAQYNQGSGAAYMNAGVLTHCEITDCTATPSGNADCTRTVYLTKRSDVAPRLSNCLIRDCDGSNGGSKGKGGNLITLGDYCLVDNCTIVDCVSYSGSSLIYCSAANNSYAKSGHVVNCAIFGQDSDGSKAKCAWGASYNNAKWPKLYYNCVTEVQIKEGDDVGYNCVESTPAACFTNYAGKDYSVLAGGPLVDAGDASEYCLPFPSVDFAGKSRVSGTAIDIGCYELQSAAKKSGLTILIR